VELLERIGSRTSVRLGLPRAGVTSAPRIGVELDGSLKAAIVGRDGERFRAAFEARRPAAREAQALGRMPLPYIKRAPRRRDPLDRERYQTVFARRPGAVAAPTAWLHFTPALLDELKRRGIEVTHVTLHTGLGTFAPLRTERIEDHRMHAERYEISTEAAHAIRRAREREGRVVAVATTVVRTLETAADSAGLVRAGSGKSELFIRGARSRRWTSSRTSTCRSTLLGAVSARGASACSRPTRKPSVQAIASSPGDAMVISDELVPRVRDQRSSAACAGAHRVTARHRRPRSCRSARRAP
jgi:S-adenosylmethionine:tRNA ribosyltransferase-isomerase